MPDPFIQKLNEKHLCSWYILPLLDLNVEAFGHSNFINSYLIHGKRSVAVHVADPNLCLHTVEHPCYVETISNMDRDFLIFEIPTMWAADLRRFIQGRYTKMSDEAKQKIRELCGLKYEVKDSAGNLITDAILMALEQHESLKNKWMEVLQVREDDLPEELLSPPSHSSFIIL